MSVTGFYIVGGEQRSHRPLHAGNKEWYKYRKALILEVNPEKREVKTCVDYVSPSHTCADEEPAILFKSGTLVGNALYACTQTEVIVYRVPDFEQIHYVSLPHFNDLHHVRPTPAGNLLVVNTGLDMVMEITLEGEVLREWNVLGEEPWDRFSREVDYRKVPSTKPHLAHPNFSFYIGDEAWVTRFEQRDAICLTDPRKRIEIGLERPHDGVPHGERVYFTTVNGHVVIANHRTRQVEEIIDLNELTPENAVLGWCRGIAFDGDKAWIGFSRLRPTKWRGNVSWVTRGFKDVLPTRIACYDLARKECLTNIELEEYGLSAVFGIYPHSGAVSNAVQAA